jgi:hypothetical protein
MTEFIPNFRHYLGQQSANPISDIESGICTTIEGMQAKATEPFWIQLHAGLINFQHLDAPEKQAVLDGILAETGGPAEVDVETASYVTFDVSRLQDPVVDRLLIGLLRNYYEADESHGYQFHTEEL